MARGEGDTRYSRVERTETAVMYLEVRDEPPVIQEAWERLEATLGSLRGRRFFGTFGLPEGRYRASVAHLPDDDPDALNLLRGTIPGGTYLRVRLRGDPPALYERIPSSFDELLKAAGERDEERPAIEFYRRLDEVDLLLPIQRPRRPSSTSEKE